MNIALVYLFLLLHRKICLTTVARIFYDSFHDRTNDTRVQGFHATNLSQEMLIQ